MRQLRNKMDSERTDIDHRMKKIEELEESAD